MEYAINILEKERELVIVSLKNGEKERLTDLKQLDKALGWLRLLKEQQIGMVKKYQLERMPPIDGRGGFSSYRIVIDPVFNLLDRFRRDFSEVCSFWEPTADHSIHIFV